MLVMLAAQGSWRVLTSSVCSAPLSNVQALEDPSEAGRHHLCHACALPRPHLHELPPSSRTEYSRLPASGLISLISRPSWGFRTPVSLVCFRRYTHPSPLSFNVSKTSNLTSPFRKQVEEPMIGQLLATAIPVHHRRAQKQKFSAEEIPRGFYFLKIDSGWPVRMQKNPLRVTI